MTVPTRIFAAIVPPAELCEEIAQGLAHHSGIRWNPASNMHITLVFDPACADVPALTTKLQAAVTGLSPFRLRIGGAGSFQTRRTSTLWLAADGATAEDKARLQSLRLAVGGRADAVGHLTLARTPTPDLALAAIAALPARDWRVEEIGLYRSILGEGPEGHSHYDLFARLPFAPPQTGTL